jgi:hypothetical protein
VFVGLAERCGLEKFGTPWCAVAADFQTFQKKKTAKTFDDAKWMLTTTQIAPKCQGTAGLAHLCQGTLVGEHTYRGDKRVHEIKGTRGRSSLADLRPTCRVVLHGWLLGIIPSEIKGHVLSKSRACWFAFLVAQSCQVGQRG